MIQLDNLALARSGRTILHGLSTTLEPGAIHVVLGPNGTGKTTLLRAMAGDLPLAGGAITHGEHRRGAQAPGRRVLEAWRRDFTYMPQDCSTEVSLSVLEVVVLGNLGQIGLRLDDALLQRAMEKLSQVGIAHLAGRSIGSLSGGQRQMAFFAQVLMREPEVMLLDEPVSALDLRHQIALLDRVRQETRSRNLVTVVVLHDLNLACQYADNLLVLVDGKLAASGHPGEIVTAELLQRTYGVAVDILKDRQGRPVVQPLSAQAFA
ncbi:ABC transporter ATP-binding protein [Pseudomonas argentinensis]|uniref:ABC transporter ATP-binding protein n=1 Tax=Phytopseudomonas argentinensis TaxID=289370 RepID=UPI0008A85780|nr:ABC transporter ATP-binding protein [Pseudomonas argentinensis]